MGNIKHNDELLRIHDDGFDVVFNCDNKHQNGVSYHAEKNGKKTKIDPEYAMAALVKKVSGAAWPADMPVPSAEGYGYTEGSATVVLPQETINISGYAEQMSGRFHIDKNTTYTVIINDDEYVITTGNVFGNYHYIGANPNNPDFSEYPFYIYTGFADTAKTPYFKHKDNGNYKVTVKLGSETIHKVDEKYLPASGGMMVVKITYNEDDDTLSCNHTYDEIVEAFPNIIFVDDANAIGYFCNLVNDDIDDWFYASIIGTSTAIFDDGERIASISRCEYIIRPDNTVEFTEYSGDLG